MSVLFDYQIFVFKNIKNDSNQSNSNFFSLDISFFLGYIGLDLCDVFYEKYCRYSDVLFSDEKQLEIDLDDLKRIRNNHSNKSNRRKILILSLLLFVDVVHKKEFN
jgi:hypothetical protein